MNTGSGLKERDHRCFFCWHSKSRRKIDYFGPDQNHRLSERFQGQKFTFWPVFFCKHKLQLMLPMVIGFPFRTVPQRRKLLVILYHGTKFEANTRNSVLNHSSEEKTTRNSVASPRSEDPSSLMEQRGVNWMVVDPPSLRMGRLIYRGWDSSTKGENRRGGHRHFHIGRMLDIDLTSEPPTPPPPRCMDPKCVNLCGQRGRKRLIASWGLRMSHICPSTPCPSPQGYRSKVESRHFAHHWRIVYRGGESHTKGENSQQRGRLVYRGETYLQGGDLSMEGETHLRRGSLVYGGEGGRYVYGVGDSSTEGETRLQRGRLVYREGVGIFPITFFFEPRWLLTNENFK